METWAHRKVSSFTGAYSSRETWTSQCQSIKKHHKNDLTFITFCFASEKRNASPNCGRDQQSKLPLYECTLLLPYIHWGRICCSGHGASTAPRDQQSGCCHNTSHHACLQVLWSCCTSQPHTRTIEHVAQFSSTHAILMLSIFLFYMISTSGKREIGHRLCVWQLNSCIICHPYTGNCYRQCQPSPKLQACIFPWLQKHFCFRQWSTGVSPIAAFSGRVWCWRIK